MPSEIRTVTVIGSGNVAWHFSRVLSGAGIRVYERSPRVAHAENLIDANSDCYIIAVNDKAIQSVAETIELPKNCLLLHTSGSVPSEILSAVTPRFGVLYPLQTLTKGVLVDFREVPLLIEASNHEDLAAVRNLAEKISGKVTEAGSELRMKIHIAAVFASNFPNLMYIIAGELLKETGMELDILRPLIAESARKTMFYPPSEIQTGPAKRGDTEVIGKHLELLADYPEYAEIYKVLSKAIYKRFNKT